MPGRFALSTPVEVLAGEVGIASGGIADQPRRFNVAPGQEILVLGPDGFSMMRWGIIPVGRVNARGRPVLETIVNARGETVFDKSAFAGTGRAVVPADCWYEWTGERRKKIAWRIRRTDGGVIWFAAITDVWIAPGGRKVPQVATVTCEPSEDVRDIHDRMGVILTRSEIRLWIDGSETVARDLIRPAPPGTLVVEKAVGVDWSGA